MNDKIGLVLDVDDTIVHLGNYVDIFAGIMKKVARDDWGADLSKYSAGNLYSSFIAPDYRKVENNLKGVRIHDPDKYWKRVVMEDRKERRNHYGGEIYVYDDVGVLREMSEDGFVLGILTDQPRMVTDDYVREFDLGFIKHRFSGEYSSWLAKPETPGCDFLLDMMGRPRKVVFVGDSKIDAITANKMGIPFIHKKSEIDYEIPEGVIAARIETFHELPDAIENVLGMRR